MTQLFDDYIWKNGIPVGIKKKSTDQHKYKIVSDPYFKHISIEKYIHDQFVGIIYDSRLIDFRHLIPAEHLGWEKSILSENQEETVCLIRDHQDRIVYKEIHQFRDGLCIGCSIFSPHGLLVARTEITYIEFDEECNQLKLFDANDHLVMRKTYEWDAENRQFSNLLSEHRC